MKVVCVKVCDVIEAQAGKALLEANGIRAEITPYSEAAVSAVAGGTGAMGILVRDADYQAALALLGTGEYETTPLSLAQVKHLVENELASGKSPAQVQALLVERGWDEAGAQQVVQQGMSSARVQPVSPVEQAERTQHGLRQMGRGLVQIALGAALTAGSSLLAHQGTSSISLIFYGLIIFGLIDFGAGLATWWKHRG